MFASPARDAAATELTEILANEHNMSMTQLCFATKAAAKLKVESPNVWRTIIKRLSKPKKVNESLKMSTLCDAVKFNQAEAAPLLLQSLKERKDPIKLSLVAHAISAT